jgi:sensor histidine kinase YesM
VFADPERAAHMITQLSDLLRYQLGLDQRTHQSLEEECAVARNYLEIETARLDPRLSYAFDIGAGCGELEIPALTVLTAVENAVKHGVAPNPGPGWVRVSAHKGVQGWVLEVVNSCDRPSSSPSTGIGLRNLAERLALSSNGRSHIEHWREAGTFHLRMELPA